MVTVRRNTHQINGTSVPVIEVWRKSDADPGDELVVSVQLDENEKVIVEIEEGA